MIYCVPISDYPESPIEETSYKDENGFEWRIARTEKDCFVRYFGEPYFIETAFDCDLSDGSNMRVKNTNCIFFEGANFDDFCDIRNILQGGYTDEIWECFEQVFTERLNFDKSLLFSELIF